MVDVQVDEWVNRCKSGSLMVRWMKEWMIGRWWAGWIDAWKHEWMVNGWVDGWIYVCMEECMVDQVFWVDRQVAGYMDRCMHG